MGGSYRRYDGPNDHEWTFITARLAGVAIFCGALAWQPGLIPRPLLTLGGISYSIYLLHPLVIALVPAPGGALGATVVWVVLTMMLALLTERWIERPMSNLGRWLTRARPQPQTAVITF